MKALFISILTILSILFLPQIILAQDLGTISPPPSVPNVGTDPSGFVAGLIRNGIFLLVIIAFIVGVIWIIFAGFRFILAGGDEKAIASAWSQIYWGLIGLVVVIGAFAIIKLVETFFNVQIISGQFQLPQR
jgi:Na+/serine symporter